MLTVDFSCEQTNLPLVRENESILFQHKILSEDKLTHPKWAQTARKESVERAPIRLRGEHILSKASLLQWI